MNAVSADAKPENSKALLLEVAQLRKSFGGVTAVDGVSFSVARGEMVALIGPNGAGKSTCFNLINGQLAADAGCILFEGRSLRGLPPRAIGRLGIGRTFQVAATFATLSVLENVQTALLSRQRQQYVFARRAIARHADEAMGLLEQVGMQAHARRPCGALAYGDIKRVELALALANSPRLLLMDEPTAGMASAERSDLMDLVAQLVLERRIGVLFTEHSMDVVFNHANRIVVLAGGRVIASGHGEAIARDEQVRRAYFGRSLLNARMPGSSP